MTDYICLPPSALTDDLWRNPYAARLYFYLLKKSDENGIWKVSLREIRDDLGLTRQQYRVGLEVLKATSIATAKGTAKTTAISICKSANKHTPATSIATAKTTAKTTAKFTPPTDVEVAAYITEKGYHFNPEQFVPFYQSKGWMVGKNPMKDWRASCRTWEIEWKKKYGTKFYYEIQPIATADNIATRKAQRSRGLSLATEIVARSESLLNLYNGGSSNSDTRKD